MSFFVVVTQGGSLGARVEVAGEPKVVGRAREADLVVTDPAISRRHLELVAVGDQLSVRCLDGAHPFVVASTSYSELRLGAGSTIVLGSSVLSVGRSERIAISDAEVTDAGALRRGFGADVRGLASVVALVDQLEAASGRDALSSAVGEWAAAQLGASGVEFLPADPSSTMVREDAGPCVEARCATELTRALAFHFRAGTTIDDATRRLVLVAARIVAAFLTERQLVRSTEEDRDALRTMAVGSATEFLGGSAGAETVAKLVTKLAVSDATVLLLGESGVGKTFVARLIHEAGPKRTAPLRVVNCAAIPSSLLESELFGHERGAFTGADAARSGAFESAGCGTILPDEIGELSLASQAKLLHVLEDRRFSRLGSNKTIVLHARVIAATNQDLSALVQEGRFRSDLFFRISVVTLRVPSLRERVDDVPLLARRMLADLASSAGRRIAGFSSEAMALLCRYPWPGNVRELRNALEHAIVLGDGPIVQVSDLPDTLRAIVHAAPSSADETSDTVVLPAKLDWLEMRAIAVALRKTGGNRTHAAAMLGINRATLYKKLPVGEK